MIICSIPKFILLVPIHRILAQLTLEPYNTAKSRTRPTRLINISKRRCRLAYIIIISIKPLVIYLLSTILLSYTSVLRNNVIHFLNDFYLLGIRLFLRVEYFDVNFVFGIVVAYSFERAAVATEVNVLL